MTTTHTPKKPFWTQGTTIAAILVGGFLLIVMVFFAAMATFGSSDDSALTPSEERRFNELLDQGNRSIAETAFAMTWEDATWEEKDAMCSVYDMSPALAYDMIVSNVSSFTAREFSFRWFDNFLSQNC